MKIGIHYKNGSLEKAFSRLDMMVVLGTLAIVLLVKLSALAGSRQPGQSVMCMNNLRQLGAALLMYSAENNSLFPERRISNSWAEKLRPFYKDLQVLQCPIDGPRGRTSGYDPRYPADMAPRSYLLNGWNDYFWQKILLPHWGDYLTYASSNSISEIDIPLPGETIVFGEKIQTSTHFYMDILEGNGDDLEQVAHAHHHRSQSERSKGGANYTFADGSVRYLGFGEAIAPENLWAVDRDFRQATVVP